MEGASEPGASDHRFGWVRRLGSESVDSIPRNPQKSSGWTPRCPSCESRDAKKLLSLASVNSGRPQSRAIGDIRARRDRNARSRCAECHRLHDGSTAHRARRHSTGYRCSGGRAPRGSGCARRVDRSVSATMDGTRGRRPQVCGRVDGGACPGGPVRPRALTSRHCPHACNTPEARSSAIENIYNRLSLQTLGAGQSSFHRDRLRQTRVSGTPNSLERLQPAIAVGRHIG